MSGTPKYSSVQYSAGRQAEIERARRERADRERREREAARAAQARNAVLGAAAEAGVAMRQLTEAAMTIGIDISDLEAQASGLTQALGRNDVRAIGQQAALLSQAIAARSVEVQRLVHAQRLRQETITAIQEGLAERGYSVSSIATGADGGLAVRATTLGAPTIDVAVYGSGEGQRIAIKRGDRAQDQPACESTVDLFARLKAQASDRGLDFGELWWDESVSLEANADQDTRRAGQ